MARTGRKGNTANTNTIVAMPAVRQPMETLALWLTGAARDGKITAAAAPAPAPTPSDSQSSNVLAQGKQEFGSICGGGHALSARTTSMAGSATASATPTSQRPTIGMRRAGLISDLTLEMSGGWRHAQCAGSLPLD
jgi:hypothetical protein